MGGRERRWRWHRHKKEEEEGIDFSQRRIGCSRFDKDIFLGKNAANFGGNVVCINKLNHAFWELVVEFPEFSHMLCTVHTSWAGSVAIFFGYLLLLLVDRGGGRS